MNITYFIIKKDLFENGQYYSLAMCSRFESKIEIMKQLTTEFMNQLHAAFAFERYLKIKIKIL